MSDPVDTRTEAVERMAMTWERLWGAERPTCSMLRALVAERDQKDADIARLDYEAMWWRDRADAAEARVRDLESAQQWRPIDTAPKGMTVLVAGGKARYIAYQTNQPAPMVDTWRHENGAQLPIWPTHWMPLPSLPAQKEPR